MDSRTNAKNFPRNKDFFNIKKNTLMQPPELPEFWILQQILNLSFIFNSHKTKRCESFKMRRGQTFQIEFMDKLNCTNETWEWIMYIKV
jgi:hypothetical protein